MRGCGALVAREAALALERGFLDVSTHAFTVLDERFSFAELADCGSKRFQ